MWDIFWTLSEIGDFIEDKANDLGSFVEDRVTDLEVFVEGKASALGDLVESTSSDFDTLLNDIADITVSGVSSMVTGEGDIECASDIDAEANQIISKANDKYELAIKEIREKLRDLEVMGNRLYKKKVIIAEKINSTLDTHLNVPTQVKTMEMETTSYKEEFLSSIWKTPFYLSRGGRVLDGAVRILGANGRINQAKQHRNEAKDYEIKVLGEIARLNRIEACILKAKSTLETENAILEAIEISLAKKRPLEYKDVVKEIEFLLAESVLNKEGFENQKYRSAICELKKIVGD